MLPTITIDYLRARAVGQGRRVWERLERSSSADCRYTKIRMLWRSWRQYPGHVRSPGLSLSTNPTLASLEECLGHIVCPTDMCPSEASIKTCLFYLTPLRYCDRKIGKEGKGCNPVSDDTQFSGTKGVLAAVFHGSATERTTPSNQLQAKNHQLPAHRINHHNRSNPRSNKPIAPNCTFVAHRSTSSGEESAKQNSR